MLNINSRISLSHRSKKIIKKLKRNQNGSFDVNSWSLINKTVKNELSKKLLLNQRAKCAYCERYLIAIGHEIDHFIHKGSYPQYSFTGINLFYSCKSCNSTLRKGQKPTISASSRNYKLCTFSIVHPFLHNPDLEIIFKDADRVYFDWDNCSDIGKCTVDFFKFRDYQMTQVRARTLIIERYSPFTSLEEMKLIRDAVAYKP